MSKIRFRGFTLIELLVVIAIIGILSAVILASLNTARQKGADASIQSNLDTIRTQAELYYGDNSDAYATTAVTTCPTTSSTNPTNMFQDPTINQALNQVKGESDSVSCAVTVGHTGKYVAYAKLVTDTTEAYCIDSTGAGTTTLYSRLSTSKDCEGNSL